MSSNDLTREEWRQQKIEKRAAFTKLQNLTYQEKNVAPGTYGTGIQRRDD